MYPFLGPEVAETTGGFAPISLKVVPPVSPMLSTPAYHCSIAPSASVMGTPPSKLRPLGKPPFQVAVPVSRLFSLALYPYPTDFLLGKGT